MTEQTERLSFRVSSGLKNIIGRDLISDKYIAVFELVKNSYDAGASKVNISFVKTDTGTDQIMIADNGCGMTYNDIIEKWLFVAYSEKKTQNRKRSSYRDEIKRDVAGAKGVGRFSCDRLGASLTLFTKTASESFVNKVEVSWNEFEVDDSREFVNIPVQYSTVAELPGEFTKGTVLVVNELREGWNRDELLRLKRSLMKLISPDANKGELPFDIELIVPAERTNDNFTLLKAGINPDRDVVNGIIHNDIFEKLNIKTTSIEVTVSDDGQLITSRLTDRGTYIFSVAEKNRKYYGLRDISIVVFYLNQSAKVNFTRQMGGVTPKSYGSVFIYKNGFRINPYGEPGQDFFGIDQRKAQGWKRFLGTREIMGRISIKGENDEFVETTSRAHGFIQTPAVEKLADLFLEKALKVLEKYVVNLINWGEPLKVGSKHAVMPNEIGERILSQFFASGDTRDIVDIDYNPDILDAAISQNDQETLTTSIEKLESVAESTNNGGLVSLARTLKKRTEAIISHNEHLEKDNVDKEQKLTSFREEIQAREQQVFFLKSVANQSVENLVNGFHSIYTLTDATKGNITYLRDLISPLEFTNKDFILSIISQIYQSNEKANKMADLAIHGGQVLKQKGQNSLYDFINQYIAAGFAIEGIKYELDRYECAFTCRFDPSSMGIIIDNIASNSIKAGATVLHISLLETNRYVEVSFTDNGIGLADNTDPHLLFEWGYSSNREKKGFGIGLYHIKQLIDEMRGTVAVDATYKQGFKLVARMRK